MFHRTAPSLVLWSPLCSGSSTGSVSGEVSHLLKKRDRLCLIFPDTCHYIHADRAFSARIFKDSLFSADFISFGQLSVFVSGMKAALPKGKQVERGVTASRSRWLLLVSLLSRVRLCVTPWIVAHRAPLSMGFSRQEYWRRLPCPPPGDLPDPGIKPAFLMSPASAGGFFTTGATWEA